jgi:hypothetical protein
VTGVPPERLELNAVSRRPAAEFIDGSTHHGGQTNKTQEQKMNLNEEQAPKEEAPAGSSSSAPHESAPQDNHSIPDQEPPAQVRVSARIAGLHAKHAQLLRMFEGTGKRNGRPLPGPAAYDRAYLTQLANYGVTNVVELVEAVLARPDGNAQRKGQEYARALAAEVVAALNAAAAELRANEEERVAEARNLTDFTVDEVRVISSDASRYELHIEGQVLVLSAKEINNQADFKQAFLNLLHRVPALPPTKGKKAGLWRELVNSWLRNAVKETLLGNATDEEVLRRAIEKAKNAIVPGDTVEALHDDMAFIENGRRYFTADAVYDRVKHLDSKLRQRHVVRLFPELGCEFHPGHPAGTRHIDVWSELLLAQAGGVGAPGAGTSPSTAAGAGTTTAAAPQAVVVPATPTGPSDGETEIASTSTETVTR